MQTVIPGLHASEPQPLGFAPGLEIRAFLLQREQGNLLVYGAATLEREADAITGLGGVARQYLNHSHEASPACDWVADTFGAPLACHADDAEEAARTCRVDDTFSERHTVDGDFEVVPIPGHTPGATAYLWRAGEHRCLFTGDTIYFPGERWAAAVLDGISDRARYIESLELIRDLDFDVVVPSIARAGRPFHAVVDRAEATRHIDGILGRLRAGEDR